ncbi:MAG: NADP-dependent malic enzyme [Gemmatimonadota bacterium]|nr:NADP-dependent malic enzyme [Gemmatimonadota bacterium]MDE2986227.1 NADP-dependent malic enzyme [Gemmatimonadota bacterium]
MSTFESDALVYHAEGRPGKIEVVPTKAVATQRDLTLAYSPGVAEPCMAIHDNPEEVFRYTARGNLVAVVSNGTAVLGLGNIGAMAAKPVMEGKGVLFKKFAGIDVFDIEIDTEDPHEVIRFCQMLEPTVGGINLEDIRAPECFLIEETLRETMRIPVFHDDQHGTAIIGGAALVNALEITGRDIGEARLVFVGAGASSVATARHCLRLGVRPENLVMTDRVGVIHEGRKEGMNAYKAQFATERPVRTLAEAMVGADVVIGLSAKGLIDCAMVESMAPAPIIFALANPDPEITPEEVARVRDDAIMATGRSDYPNQVNNVLGFPFLFRGALDVRARRIDQGMMLAATRALAELARDEVPESVVKAYGDDGFEFGPEYLIPKPFDPRVLLHVSPAVAKAAMDSGAARTDVDLEEYRDRLEASLGPGREAMRRILGRARKEPARIVLADGYNERVLRAAAQVMEEGTARIVLIGKTEKIHRFADELGIDLRGVECIHPPAVESMRYEYAEAFHRRRERKGLTLAEARARAYQPVYFAAMMVAAGDADAMVAGIDSNYPQILRPVLGVIGTSESVRKISGLHMVAFRDRDPLFFADTTVNIDPDPETLAEIAVSAARFVRDLGIEPRIGMLSFSNFGSVRHPEAAKVREAVDWIKRLAPEVLVDGEMQADVAVDPHIIATKYPFSDLTGPANVLVFPTLSASNASYKLLAQLGNAEVIGPVLLGMKKPVHILQRGCSVLDVVHLIGIASVDART